MVQYLYNYCEEFDWYCASVKAASFYTSVYGECELTRSLANCDFVFEGYPLH